MKNQMNPQKVLRKALNYPYILDFNPDSSFAKFSCIKECKKCCGYTYFLFTEVHTLPMEIRDNLILREDRYEVSLQNKRCIFYKESERGYYCTIHSYRPLRCRIYPYFPLIVDQRIIITLEPAIKMLKDTKQPKECPGIGTNGKNLQETIEECLNFLHMLNQSHRLLETFIIDGEKFNRIRNDQWFFVE